MLGLIMKSQSKALLSKISKPVTSEIDEDVNEEVSSEIIVSRCSIISLIGDGENMDCRLVVD